MLVLQMKEILATARKLGHDLPEEVMDQMIHCDPMDLYLKPSMQCDIEKVPSPASNFSALDQLLMRFNRGIIWNMNT